MTDKGAALRASRSAEGHWRAALGSGSSSLLRVAPASRARRGTRGNDMGWLAAARLAGACTKFGIQRPASSYGCRSRISKARCSQKSRPTSRPCRALGCRSS